MSALASLVDKGLMAPDWARALAPVDERITEIGKFLRAENAAGPGYMPCGHDIFRAFQRPLADVRVLLVGQDPYPTRGNPIGLSFAVDADVSPLPESLKNIFKELYDDLDLDPTKPPLNGDLSPWADQGVMLLNRVLTVRPGAAGSHRGHGWEEVTECAITALVDRGGPLAAILWGADARSLKPKLGEVKFVESVHPSPLSARNGFFGSQPFSKVNALLKQQGADEIDWTLPTRDLPE